MKVGRRTGSLLAVLFALILRADSLRAQEALAQAVLAPETPDARPFTVGERLTT